MLYNCDYGLTLNKINQIAIVFIFQTITKVQYYFFNIINIISIFVLKMICVTVLTNIVIFQCYVFKSLKCIGSKSFNSFKLHFNFEYLNEILHVH